MAKALGLIKNLPLGKAVTAKISKCLPVGAFLTCADNTGAKVVQLISVRGYKGVRNRYPRAGVGDLITVAIKKGKPELRNQVALAIIVRQKKEYARFDGSRIHFEDNAVVMVSEDGLPRGTEIKGAVAKEVTERWHKVGAIASVVV